MVEKILRHGTLIAATLGAFATMTLGCLTDASNPDIPEVGPAFGVDGADFKPVSAVLERRCGNLDCHGSPYRALKIYGKFGLRRPQNLMDFPMKDSMGMDIGGDYDSYYSGGIPTTIPELTDNYDSVISLEPVLMQSVILKQAKAAAPIPCPTETGAATMTVDCLTLVRKPRLQEKHKGGPIWRAGGDGDRCLTGWINNVPDSDACEIELSVK
jgi:hypothetical protein